MFLFGLEGSGFIISLALTLLMSGAIMFYCLKRFSMLENSMVEQGRVLQSFIMRSQQGGMDNLPSNMAPPGLATDIALKSAIEQTTEHDSSKIEVSDDDDDNDDDDDDTDDSDEEGNMEEVSSTDATSDSDNEDRIVYEPIENPTETPIELQTEEMTLNSDIKESINVASLIGTLSTESDSVKIVSMEEMGPELLNFHLDSASETSESDNDLTDKLEIEQVADTILNKIEVSKKPSLSKMKVEDLRNLVVEKEKVEDIEAAKKLKRTDLLKLLQ